MPDPSNPQQFNRYSYVLNSPLNFRDPTGHICEDVGGNTICSDDNDDSSDIGTWFAPLPASTQTDFDWVDRTNAQLNQVLAWPIAVISSGRTYLPWNRGIPIQEISKPAAVNATRFGIYLAMFSGIVSERQIYGEYRSGDLTDSQFLAETGVNVAVTGGVTYLGATGLSTAAGKMSVPLIGSCVGPCWFVAGTVSVAYVAPIAQETVNNTIEGQSFGSALITARSDFHEKVVGTTAANGFDNMLDATVLSIMQAAGDGVVWVINAIRSK